ncbi:MAG TPA: OB-fold nucleic acid binding domain-containing protein [Gemmatimonadota bacterium]|nr:OB-fold nucleic acid binding domain-containing protein [Gemmatimonadota bacterium]
MPARPAATVLFASALFLLAACRGTVPIGDLLDDPGRYDGERVRVEGRVTGFSFGALGRGAFQVDDGTGTLPVVSERGATPREGARVGIEGIFRSVFTFGDRSGAVLLERDRFDP